MSAAAWAERYVTRFRLALVPLNGKRPIGEGWNADQNLIRTAHDAREYWTRHPRRNIGVCLEPSGLVSLDADYPDGACRVLAAEGIDLDALIASTPTVLGRAPRLEFRAPQLAAIAVEMLPALEAEARKRQEVTSTYAPRGANGQLQPVPPKSGEPVVDSSKHSGEAVVQAAKITGVGKTLGRKSIIWPARTPGEKPVTVLELRAGRLQDVLPPSVHPDLHRPYRWLTPPRNGFPPLPDALLQLWQNFDTFKHRARNLCPWADPEPEPTWAPRTSPRPRTGPSVIAEFNAAHDAIAILEIHGYVRAGKRRWKSPYGHGIAGIVLLPDGKIFSHHTSDPLGDEKPHDAFDLFALFEHAGDQRAAVKAAAEMLGMSRGRAA